MEKIITFVTQMFVGMITTVFESLVHNWLPLSLAILSAAVMKAYVDSEKLKEWLQNRPRISTVASVAFGAFTPFCACGTMAVIIGMLTTTVPWGPVMAFLTSSPLMSPDGFIMLSGIISFKFAIAMAVASVAIGLGSGYVTHIIETKTGFLANQTRFSGKSQEEKCGCAKTGCCNSNEEKNEPAGSCMNCSSKVPKRIKWRELTEGLVDIGLKQILLYFSIFNAVGYLINSLVPASIISGLFGFRNLAAVPLATLIGLPLYLTTESSIPVILSLIKSGASEGAMLAFMISGAATSAWVIAGISTFMKKRAVCLYIMFIVAGGILSGYIYDLLSMLIAG